MTDDPRPLPLEADVPRAAPSACLDLDDARRGIRLGAPAERAFVTRAADGAHEPETAPPLYPQAA